MADRILLHLGLPSTGTRSLPRRLGADHEGLARAGLSCPGWAPDAQELACHDLLDVAVGDVPDREVVGAWHRLVELASRAPGTAVLGADLLAGADPEAAARALADLAPAEVHLVVTVRDLARQLAAAWQQDVRGAAATRSCPLSFARFLDAAGPDPDVTRWQADAFWYRQDVPAVLRRWGADAAPDRVHVVVVPPAGSRPGLLDRRLAGLLGVGPELLGPERSLPCADPVPELPAEHRDWVAARASRTVADLAAAGYAVTGDLAELAVP